MQANVVSTVNTIIETIVGMNATVNTIVKIEIQSMIPNDPNTTHSIEQTCPSIKITTTRTIISVTEIHDLDQAASIHKETISS